VLIRDHDAANFAARKKRLEEIAGKAGARHPAARVELKIEDQYRNMEEGIARVPELVERALEAVRSVGFEPRIVAIRGGTDGAALTQMGIPCPNLGTGGRNYHGECEYAIVEEAEQAEKVLLFLAQ